MKIEIWKDIKGYEGLYQVSNLGNIKSLTRLKNNHSTLQVINEKLKNTRLSNGGYLIADLYKNNTSKTLKVHRLVAETFIPNVDNKPTVNHKDGNKLNNVVENLEWATFKEQNKHFYEHNLKSKESINKSIHSMNIVTSKKVKCLTTNTVYNSINEASRSVTVSANLISKCCRGINKSAGKTINNEPLKWEFVKGGGVDGGKYE